MKKKLIVILGPTATGKSDLAVRLAADIGGEIVSADSRQVYRGMDLGTGKITEREMRGIPHHLLSVASPRGQYSVVRYARDARRAITSVYRGNRVPVLVGGTGLYIDAVARGTSVPGVPPDKRLRARLEKQTTAQLLGLLKKKDPGRAKTIDPHNRRRLIRALEIVAALGTVPRIKTPSGGFDALFIGLTLPKERLQKRIGMRLRARLSRGMLGEVRTLHAQGLSWKKLDDFGLEYRYLSRLAQKKITKEETIRKLQTEIWRYAKRQMTWFKRHGDIHWFAPSDYVKIKTLSKKFLTS
jgi:tRNA dimethylallyltransferase